MKIELVTTLKRQPTAYLVNVKDYEFMQQRMKYLKVLLEANKPLETEIHFPIKKQKRK